MSECVCVCDVCANKYELETDDDGVVGDSAANLLQLRS